MNNENQEHQEKVEQFLWACINSGATVDRKNNQIWFQSEDCLIATTAFDCANEMGIQINKFIQLENGIWWSEIHRFPYEVYPMHFKEQFIGIKEVFVN